MKQNLTYFLAANIFFVIIACFWVIFGVNNIQLINLFLGLNIGIFILDIDHFIFWFFSKPKSEESKIVKSAIKDKNFKSIAKIVRISHQTHNNLIFHHYFFQFILVIFSLFILLSYKNTFASSLILGINIHLVIDEFISYRSNPKNLQKWLFARETKQLPLKFLRKYLLIFLGFTLLFTFILIQSKI